jgi:hypothetical protein
MLKRESVVPCRRCQLARTVATWSLGALVVGAALIDATVLSEDPVADTANVELSDEQAAAAIARLERERILLLDRLQGELRELDRIEILRATDDVTVPAVWNGARWRRADEPVPDTKLTVDLPKYELTHGGHATEMAVVLRPPCAGAYARLNRSTVTRSLPAAVSLTDGTHFVATMCPGDETTLVTELVVGPR